jgi:heme A synthase
LLGLHIAVGICLIALNAIAFAVGGIAWYRNRPSIPFWYLLRAAQASVFAQALLGGLMVVTGHEQEDGLHYLYGILPLVVSFIGEGARADAAHREIAGIDYESLPDSEKEPIAHAIIRREMGIMAVSCGVILFLGLRAAGTSGL